MASKLRFSVIALLLAACGSSSSKLATTPPMDGATASDSAVPDGTAPVTIADGGSDGALAAPDVAGDDVLADASAPDVAPDVGEDVAPDVAPDLAPDGPREVPFGIAERLPNPSCRPTGDPAPEMLAGTGCFDSVHPTEPIAAAIPFAVNAELWSDGLAKRRWMVLPDGQKIKVQPDGDWDLPNGTVLIKEFAEPTSGKRLETRLLSRRDDGSWAGVSYLWNSDLGAAVRADLAPTTILPREDGQAAWVVPSGQCLTCHVQRKGVSLGLETRQLNRSLVYPGDQRANQLATLDHLGLLDPPVGDPGTAPALPDPFGTAPVAQRARAYLDVNCSHCHPFTRMPNLLYDTTFADTHLCDVMPSINVPGTTKIFAPGDPEHSEFLARMKSLLPIRMPKLGSKRVHQAAIDLMTQWITETTACQ
jgi:uncharacterized repeat protein (TIGR03806 family)